MANALHDSTARGTARTRDWRKSMSDNVAWALLVYTALQIFVTVEAMKHIVTRVTDEGLIIELFATDDAGTGQAA